MQHPVTLLAVFELQSVWCSAAGVLTFFVYDQENWSLVERARLEF